MHTNELVVDIHTIKMNTMKKLLFVFFFLTTALYGQSKVGSTALPFLNIGIGARPMGMGGAFVATANDATALYWNTAGIAHSNTNEVMFNHVKWFADIDMNWVGAMVRVGDMGTAGLSLTYLDYGKTEVTNDEEQEGTGEYYSASDMSLALSYAYNLTDRFAIGMNFKYLREQIWHSASSGFAVDIGTLFTSDIYGLRIGASISNFGSDMKRDGKDLEFLHDIDPTINGNNDQIHGRFLTDSWPLPLTFRVGFAKDFMIGDMNRLTLAVDAVHPTDNSESLNLGTEYAFNENIMLRAGYNSLLLDNSEQGLALGFGLQHEFATDFTVRVDYNYQDFGILENTQQFSVGVRF